MAAPHPNPFSKEGEVSKLTSFELDALRYAERNHGRSFIAEHAGADDPHNAAISRLTDAGLFVDGGASASGRWRVLTPAGRAALNSPVDSEGEG